MFNPYIKNFLELWDINICGAILLDHKGAFFSNQTGGCCCHHPVAQGWLLEFNPTIRDALIGEGEDILYQPECDDVHGLVNNKLYDLGVPFKITSTQSEEAWLIGSLDLSLLPKASIMRRASGMPRQFKYRGEMSGIVPAILTWPNSD